MSHYSLERDEVLHFYLKRLNGHSSGLFASTIGMRFFAVVSFFI
jgi:hypothetical protein